MKAWCLNPECRWRGFVDTDEPFIYCPYCETIALVYTDYAIPEFIEEEKEEDANQHFNSAMD